MKKLRKTDTKKNAPTEIRSENHTIIFYDSDGIIHKEFIPQDLINGNYWTL